MKRVKLTIFITLIMATGTTACFETPAQAPRPKYRSGEGGGYSGKVNSLANWDGTSFRGKGEWQIFKKD
jgi:hypothetical protein